MKGETGRGGEGEEDQKKEEERRFHQPGDLKLDQILACWWCCSESKLQHQIRSDVVTADWLSKRMGRSQAGLHVRVSSGCGAAGAAPLPAAESRHRLLLAAAPLGPLTADKATRGDVITAGPHSFTCPPKSCPPLAVLVGS